jgi:hypothetical protein
LNEATQAALDLAAGLQIDLNTAMQLIGRAASGNISLLSRYGIELKSTGDKAKDFQNLLEIIRGSMGGMAENEAKQLSGMMTQLKNAVGDLIEGFGKWLNQSEMLKGVVKKLTDAIGKMADKVKDVQIVWKNVWHNIVQITKNVFLNLPKIVGVGLKYVFNVFVALARAMPKVFPPALALILTLIVAFANEMVPLAIRAAKNFAYNFAGTVNTILSALFKKIGADKLAATFAEGADHWIKKMNQLKGGAAEFEKTMELVRKENEALLGGTKVMLEAIGEGLRKAGKDASAASSTAMGAIKNLNLLAGTIGMTSKVTKAKAMGGGGTGGGAAAGAAAGKIAAPSMSDAAAMAKGDPFYGQDLDKFYPSMATQEMMKQRDAQMRLQEELLSSKENFLYNMLNVEQNYWDQLGGMMSDAARNVIGQSYAMMTDAFSDMIAGVNKGKGYWKKAMMEMAASTVLSIGQQATVEALFNLAKGYAALGNPITAPLAGYYFKAAAVFGKVAAVATVAGVGMMAAAKSMKVDEGDEAGGGMGGGGGGGRRRKEEEGAGAFNMTVHIHNPIGGMDEIMETQVGPALLQAVDRKALSSGNVAFVVEKTNE